VGKKVVIIGAGPGGLAAAMRLAHAGCEVTLLERQTFVGGRTSAFESEGYRFDRGPTFFLYPQILSRIFAHCGYDLFSEIPMRRLDPQYRLVFGTGGMLDASADIEQMEAQIRKLAPQDVPGFRRFLAENRKKLASFRSILESPFYRLRDFFRRDVLRSLPHVRAWRSLHGELGRFFSDPRLRLAFTFQGKYLGMSPFQCPSLFSILAFLEYEYGVYHPIGGCAAVSERMAQLASQLGADVRTGEEVEELTFQGSRVVGVRTPRATYQADALVINADFAHAMTHLVPDTLRRRWTDRKLKRKKYSCSTFMMYLGLEGKQPELAHHTIYLAPDYAGNLDDIQRRHRLSEDPSFYVQNACVTDPTLAPEDGSTLYVLVPVSHQHQNIDWNKERGPMRQRVLKQLRNVGLENVKQRIRTEHIITPADWQQRYAVYRGATFNLAHNLRQMLYWRPHNRFEDLQGVYLVGGGTHPGSGLPTIYSSAQIACQSLLEDFGLSDKIAAGTREMQPDVAGTAELVGA